MNYPLAAALALTTLLAAAPASADTPEDFARANSLASRYKGLTDHLPVEASWVEDEHVLLYGERTAGTLHYRLYDAATRQSSDAFDLGRLAKALGAARHAEIKPDDLNLHGSRLIQHRTMLETSIGYDRYRCDLQKWTCARPRDPDDPSAQSANEDPNANPDRRNSHTRVLTSPDGRWDAMVVDFNVQLRPAKGPAGSKPDHKQTVTLSTDGSEGNYYEFSSLAWSPDSTHLAAYRIRPGFHRTIRFVQSSPPDQLQPLYPEIPYTKPGDVLDLQQPVLFHIAANRQTNIDPALFPNPFDLSALEWRKDSRGFTFEYNARGHQLYRVIEVAAPTGAARVIAEESSRTFVDYRRLIPNQQDTGKIYRYDLEDGRQMLWASERDNWEHLYLLDGAGKVLRQITRGEWVVRSVDRVDEATRQIWFSASGRNPGEDPYYVHAYRIGFDGSNLTELTPGAGNHQAGYSDDGSLMFDLVSTVEQPPILRVRATAGQDTGSEVLHADISRLLAAGWAPPEPFHAPGRDGRTEIYGVIWKPAHLDPARRYPVLENIYAGPQGSFVPKNFTTRAEPLTELGFVVVQIDGMGTNNRSKAFHDTAWQNLKDAGFPDRILWHKAYAALHPWYDITRTGIFGTSAGGQNAMGALLFHPEFYKAAVANSGCHDNRMDKIWWNEQWMGWPIGPQYAASSNVENAARLEGRLMLVVGGMDDNVDPSSTFQVVDRLEKANKEFDLLYVPGGRHGAGGDYGQRELESFFIRNLRGAAVPAWNAQPASTPLPERP